MSEKNVSENIIELVNIRKEFDDNVALKNLNLNVRRNEFLTLLGPSGCGKTTTLRMIAGFEQPTSGQILCNGKCMNDVPPYLRPLNTVFQRYALFPHMSIYENIAFGLRLKKKPEAYIKERVKAMLNLVNLNGFEKRSIESLSGGQQQRIAIARALVNEPEVLLLDEPLGALDLKMRQGMQMELKDMQRRLGITFIYVTHDQEEALTMSDTIVLINEGEIQQKGTPEDIYNEPKNAFVADFIGESNIIDGMMVRDYSVHFSGATFPCVDSGFGEDNPVEVVVRPEDVQLVEKEKGQIKGVVQSVVFLGVHYEMHVLCDHGTDWLVHSTAMSPVGSEVGICVTPENIHIMEKSRKEVAADEVEA